MESPKKISGKVLFFGLLRENFLVWFSVSQIPSMVFLRRYTRNHFAVKTSSRSVIKIIPKRVLEYSSMFWCSAQ